MAKDLADAIAGKLNFPIANGGLRSDLGDQDILDYFQQRASTREEMDPYFAAAGLVRQGLVYANSIDTFIDAHRENSLVALCGKLGIAKTILEAERQSRLYVRRGHTQFADLTNLRNTWFVAFARYLHDGVSLQEIDRIFDKVSFIVFNYDRCIEHFLYHSLQWHYGISDATAAKIMTNLSIVHPYGTISALPWQSPDGGISFGLQANRAALDQMVNRIKTYTERVTEGDELARIKAMVREAETIVFLGFSYHPVNMQLLSPGNECEARQVFGTVKGIAKGDRDEVRQAIRSMLKRPLRKTREVAGGITQTEALDLDDLTCSELLQEHSRSLFIAGPLLC